jgi:hypothetical protein
MIAIAMRSSTRLKPRGLRVLGVLGVLAVRRVLGVLGVRRVRRVLGVLGVLMGATALEW